GRGGTLRRPRCPWLGKGAGVFHVLREPHRGGRCGACEFTKICGGSRCRPYATYGDYLAEDPACAYQPGQYGGTVIDLPATQTFGLEVTQELHWEDAARERLKAIPSFAWGMVIKAVEVYARTHGQHVVTVELLTEIRQTWGGRFGRKG